MQKRFFSTPLILLIAFFILSPPITLAQTIKIYDVKAKKTILKRGETFEAQLQADSINENMTINIVINGNEYFGSSGGGACRSDSTENGEDLFLGWIEDGEHPVARILCTIPYSLDSTVKTVELIAYQFRDCNNGGSRCSEVKSSTPLTIEAMDPSISPPQKAETSEDIAERISNEKPLVQQVLEMIFKSATSTSTNTATTEAEQNSDTSPQEDTEIPTPTSVPSEQAPSTVTNTDCKSHSSPSLQFVCQVYKDIVDKCTTLKPGQVLPENRECLNAVASLRPNAKANMKENAKIQFFAGEGIKCPVGPAGYSRGLQCMGFAQATWADLNGDTTSNPFMGKLEPQGTLNKSDILAKFNQYPIAQCKTVAQVGQPIWFIYTFHISVGSFIDNTKNVVEIYEGNSDYCGTVNKRNLGVNGSKITHCLIPKNLQ